MDYKKIIISNINNIHTTKLGLERIIRNINYNKDDIINYLKKMIFDNKSKVYKKGKNYYCEINNIKITINSYNYCVITAHIIK